MKDQLDENRHSTERLKKAENVIEKYKKKMEEGADLRRMFKVSERTTFKMIILVRIYKFECQLIICCL